MDFFSRIKPEIKGGQVCCDMQSKYNWTEDWCAVRITAVKSKMDLEALEVFYVLLSVLEVSLT